MDSFVGGIILGAVLASWVWVVAVAHKGGWGNE